MTGELPCEADREAIGLPGLQPQHLLSACREPGSLRAWTLYPAPPLQVSQSESPLAPLPSLLDPVVTSCPPPGPTLLYFLRLVLPAQDSCHSSGSADLCSLPGLLDLAAVAFPATCPL